MIIDACTTPGTERETRYAVDALLADMDAAGIAQAVIAPEDREMAVDNAAGNARLCALAARHPDRLIPACSVNPWYGDQGLALLRAAVHGGAKLLVLSGALQGFLPVDELADPLLELAGELGVPVYFHTGPHSHGAPSQVVLAAQRHPGTRVILGHCGTTDHAGDMPSILRAHRRPNLWFELSLVRPWGAGTWVTEETAGRFLWASGAPRNAMRFELAQFRKYLPPARFPDVYGGTLRALLEGVRAC